VDHSLFDALLKQHVAVGLVDYDAFARAPTFPRYLSALDAAPVDELPVSERLAFWINAYNAYTIQLVIAHGERNSIRNINKTLGFLALKGPWTERLARVGGRVYTLDQIENEILRREFDEPRIHFALVCAARGCPPLRSEAYTATRVDQQLEDQARHFILGSPEKNRVDITEGIVWVSMIFVHYREDFGGSKAAIGRYIAGFHPAGPERVLLESGRFALKQTPYDWSLNARPRAVR
jgi:hypothetical protein